MLKIPPRPLFDLRVPHPIMIRHKKGQRWFSTSEPGLGLGIIEKAEQHTVTLYFPAKDITRTYALDHAPLVRLQLMVGDEAESVDGLQFIITHVNTEDELLSYSDGFYEIQEQRLHPTIDLIRPQKRLQAGLVSSQANYELRRSALEWNSHIQQSPTRGFCGARIDLLPHQFAIAQEASLRLAPRLLLADEVGLGKTIEACLILHRLHFTGRADRILILVPEPLIHQWFIELLKKFHMSFSVMDEPYDTPSQAATEPNNPFTESQWIICPIEILSNSPERTQDAMAAGFDLLIVDEAHHLEWKADDGCPLYQAVEQLSRQIQAVLMLTATPSQLGPEGHFARLRLLDPVRYHSLDQFKAEAKEQIGLADLISQIQKGHLPASIKSYAKQSAKISALADQFLLSPETCESKLISTLVDLFGTGRLFFRNTRDHLSGFPKRIPHLYPIPNGRSPYDWLKSWIKDIPANEKLLLITHSVDTAVNIQETLLKCSEIKTALYHEHLSLIQRDRNAAWFADPDGARLLICSEIGSEGRNFQFAKHLVLFGLPKNPELLEQRIGRLDRIGQLNDIHIHIPHGTQESSAIHALWLHHGLDAFTSPLKAASAIAAELSPRLEALQASPYDENELLHFIRDSQATKDAITQELRLGHDKLLDIGTPSPTQAIPLIQQIQSQDQDAPFETFLLRVLDHLGLDITELSHRVYHLQRGQRLSETFADLPEEGISITLCRKTALLREDLTFLTKDHPMWLSALQALISSEFGNTSFIHWTTGKGKAIFLEGLFVIESQAPRHLNVERFLPPTLITVQVDHRGKPCSVHPHLAQNADPRPLLRQDAFRTQMLPTMLDALQRIAIEQASTPREQAKANAITTLESEIQYQQELSQRLKTEALPCQQIHLKQRDDTLAAIEQARVRLDSLRLIWHT